MLQHSAAFLLFLFVIAGLSCSQARRHESSNSNHRSVELQNENSDDEPRRAATPTPEPDFSNVKIPSSFDYHLTAYDLPTENKRALYSYRIDKSGHVHFQDLAHKEQPPGSVSTDSGVTSYNMKKYFTIVKR